MKYFIRSFQVLLLITYSIFLNGQNGFHIKINSKIQEKKIAILSVYNGSYSFIYPVDTQAIDAKTGVVVFSQKNKILGGIYHISLLDNSTIKGFDIVIDNGAKVKIETNDFDLNSTKCIDPINQHYIKIQQNGLSSEKLKEALTLFPNSTYALYIKIESAKKTIKTAKESSSTADRNSLFKTINFKDKRMQIMPNIYSLLYLYISQKATNTEEFNKSVDAFYKNYNCIEKNYYFYLEWFLKNLDTYSKIDMSKSYVYIFDTYFEKSPCKNENLKLYSKYWNKIEEQKNFPTLSKFPNIMVEDTLDQVTSIDSYIMGYDYTFISFYDPECSHCTEMMPKIKAYFTLKNLPQTSLQKIAFLNTFERKKWKEFINKNNLDQWTHITKPKEDALIKPKFSISANPKFFLLDKNGTILLRNFNPVELDQFLMSNPSNHNK